VEATMARHWKERLDPTRHVRHMDNRHIGGLPAASTGDKMEARWVYFVEACGFRFEFQSVGEAGECLRFFSEKIRPSSREPGHGLEHYWQRWHERLPLWLFEEAKRRRVVVALERAIGEWTREGPAGGMG
jgi:hypothetical protein